MSAGYSVTVVGAEELSRAFAQAPQLANKAFSRAIGSSAYAVSNRAKAGAPVRYRALRASIHVEGPTITPGNVSAQVGTNLNYAPYQEFGTGIYAGHGPITPKRGKVLAWRSGGAWHFARSVRGVKPTHFFKNAIEFSQADIGHYVEQALIDITEGLAL